MQSVAISATSTAAVRAHIGSVNKFITHVVASKPHITHSRAAKTANIARISRAASTACAARQQHPLPLRSLTALTESYLFTVLHARKRAYAP
eukprot:1938122-Rhodomonas_salina.2